MFIAALQGEIGVLDRRDMDNFAYIFITYQKLGKSNDEAGMSRADNKGSSAHLSQRLKSSRSNLLPGLDLGRTKHVRTRKHSL